jgi:hypothetical protein
MMLDWLFAELADNTLQGVLRGPNSRTDEGSVIERWNGMASYFSWLLFGNTPPIGRLRRLGPLFRAARHRLRTARGHLPHRHRPQSDYLHRDRARTRRFWRYSDELSLRLQDQLPAARITPSAPRRAGMNDPIQPTSGTSPGPRPTLAESTTRCSRCIPTRRARDAVLFRHLSRADDQRCDFEGKPSYDSPDKVMGCSPTSRSSNRSTPSSPSTTSPPANASRTSTGSSPRTSDVTEDKSGWIFARGGNAYLAYRPLAALPLDEVPALRNSGWAKAAATSAAGCWSART